MQPEIPRLDLCVSELCGDPWVARVTLSSPRDGETSVAALRQPLTDAHAHDIAWYLRFYAYASSQANDIRARNVERQLEHVATTLGALLTGPVAERWLARVSEVGRGELTVSH